MSQTIDDFMSRFGGAQTVDDRDAERFHDRFVSTHPDDGEFDNRTYHQSATQYLGKLPDAEFQEAARTAIKQAPQKERKGLLGTLLGALGGGAGGSGLSRLAEMLGLSSTDPEKLSEEEGARVMNYARREQPEALQKAVEEKPWLVKAMGNPVVMGTLAMAAAKLFQSRRGR